VGLSWSLIWKTIWRISRFYRSDAQDARGHFLTHDLLPAPAYRDMSVHKGAGIGTVYGGWTRREREGARNGHRV